jgi:hypothetical protein
MHDIADEGGGAVWAAANFWPAASWKAVSTEAENQKPVRRTRLRLHQQSARSVIIMDFDVARHGVALKTVVPTCPFARFRYGIGRDEGPSRADRKKKGNRVNDPVSQGH